MILCFGQHTVKLRTFSAHFGTPLKQSEPISIGRAAVSRKSVYQQFTVHNVTHGHPLAVSKTPLQLRKLVQSRQSYLLF